MRTRAPWIAPLFLAAIVGIALAACKKDAAPGTSESSAGKGALDTAAIKDPDGTYKYFSDPSITKPPTKGAVLGKGQTITIEYDGSKSREGDSVFYRLSYVNEEGSVQPITGGPFEGRTKGTFTASPKVFTSQAKDRPGFMEVNIVNNAKVVGGDAGVTGKIVILGMYPVRIDVAD